MTKPRTFLNDLLFALLYALWGGVAGYTIGIGTRTEAAVGSCHVHGQSLRDLPCPEGTVDGH